MVSMEETFEAACAARDIAGAVLIAKDTSGKFAYARTFGTRSLKEGTAGDPLTQDAVMWIASCTKLMTSIAAMQCVEKGLLKLDEDVVGVLPELKGLEVLEGFDADGKPQLRKTTEAITLRRLLTHTSGFSYEGYDPLLMQWRAYHGVKNATGKTIEEVFLYPLVFEPGKAWKYGCSIDWVGRMVERVNGDTKLQAYMEKNLWQPLGITDMTFFIRERPDLAARRPEMSMRDPNGSGKAVHATMHARDDDMNDALGGSGVFSSAEEYVKVLHSLLANDGKLLRAETVELMFQPQMGEESQRAMAEMLSHQAMKDKIDGLPLGLERNWGLGGMLLMEDAPAWRRKGTMGWGGLPNLLWFIDRKAGLCGMYASQIIPPGEKKSIDMASIFEQAMYERLASSNLN